MRISDWSSDVCSSDLQFVRIEGHIVAELRGNGDAPLAIDRGKIGARILAGRHNRHRSAPRIRATGQNFPGPGIAGFRLVRLGRRMPLSYCLSINYGSGRSEEHTSELQSLMRISYAVFCLKK